MRDGRFARIFSNFSEFPEELLVLKNFTGEVKLQELSRNFMEFKEAVETLNKPKICDCFLEFRTLLFKLYNSIM